MFPRDDPFNFGGDSFFRGFHEAVVAQHRRMHEEFTNAMRHQIHDKSRPHQQYQQNQRQQRQQQRRSFPVLEYSSKNYDPASRKPALRSSYSPASPPTPKVRATYSTLKGEGILPAVTSGKGKSNANTGRKERESTPQKKKSQQQQQQQQQRPPSSRSISNKRATEISGTSVMTPALPPSSPSSNSERNENEKEKGAGISISASLPQNLITVAEVSSMLESKFDPTVLNSVCDNITTCKTTFGDIASLEEPKRILHEAIMLPLLIPELFVGIREPWKGVLLFGPPGTGKTLLAKAVAGSKSTFFNMSSASLIHKYRGESEKVLKCLFEVAKLMNPSVIFFDEIDAIASSRGDASEHEASRRMKSELLSQMDGVGSSDHEDNKGVVILATTNTPWDIDGAMLRRLEKRIYIPLPDEEGRRQHMNLLLKDVTVDENIDIDDIVKKTNGYSGADLHLMTREALMGPMRRHLAGLSAADIDEKRNNGTLDNDVVMRVPPVTNDDFFESASRVRVSVDGHDLKKFQEWDQQFGSK